MTLKQKLILVMVALLGGLLVVTYWSMQRHEKTLLTQVENHVKALEKIGQVDVDQIFAEGISTEDRRKILQQLAEKNKLYQISILNDENRVILSSNPKDDGISLEELRRRRLVGEPAEEETRRELEKRLKRYDIIIPIGENEDGTSYAHAIMLLDDFKYLIARARLLNFLLTLTTFIVGIGIIIYLVNRFISPIDQLIKASEQIAQGNFEVQLKANTQDELGRLIERFNNMAVRLQQQKAWEERIKRSERLAMIGELGARLAHEIRNPLNSIALTIDHVRDRFAPRANSQEKERQEFETYLNNVRSEILRLNRLVVEFLQFARPPHVKKVPVQIPLLLQQIAQLVSTEAEKQNIQIQVEIPSTSVEILADEELLKTAFLNLVFNALQAMPGGGTLTLQVQPVAQGSPETPLRNIQILFSDTGKGIPPEYREKIFEPYFTTKEGGSGLGLTIAHQIIEEHGGLITVESQLGEGTTFKITLPLGENGGNQNERVL
jgi:signal transduction histidine kinase